jgi:hypothetical protein
MHGKISAWVYRSGPKMSSHQSHHWKTGSNKKESTRPDLEEGNNSITIDNSDNSKSLPTTSLSHTPSLPSGDEYQRRRRLTQQQQQHQQQQKAPNALKSAGHGHGHGQPTVKSQRKQHRSQYISCFEFVLLAFFILFFVFIASFFSILLGYDEQQQQQSFAHFFNATHYLLAASLASSKSRSASVSYPPPFPIRHHHQENSDRNNVVNDISVSSQALEMCTRSFWHTVASTTVVLPNEETFVFTGDIEFMWLRDSAAQVHPLLLPIFPSNNHHHHHHHHHHAIELEQQQPQQHNLPDTNHRVAMIALDPKLDRIVRGLILRTAMYICHDPYANSFHIDNTHVFTDFEKNIGRHDLIATWNYEIDSACYYFRMLYYYYRESSYGGIQSIMPTTNDLHHVQQLPRHSVLLQPRVKEAVEIMIDLWIAERRHEDDVFPVGPLFDCVNCNKPYRYNELMRDGKGSPTNSSSGLLWTAHRPSDDACMYHYLIPANMFALLHLDMYLSLPH